MKVQEFREMSPEELNQKIYSLKEELFNLRRRKAVGQLEHGEEVRRVRKDIARYCHRRNYGRAWTRRYSVSSGRWPTGRGWSATS